MRKLHRFVAAFCAVSLSLGQMLPAGAQSNGDAGIIVITVTGATAAKAALADARVFLLGPSVASALTTKSGIVKYTDVPTGLYRVRVSKGGYVGSTSAQFEVLGNKEIDVDVALGTQAAAAEQTATVNSDPNAPKIIGRVQARVTVSTHDVDDTSGVRKISDSLTDALGTIAGVTVNNDSNDPNSAQTISLRGKDESQTGVTLDGIPLSAPGSATNLRSINTDLFGGASVNFGAQAGSLGGSVNFRTLQPTQTWQERFSSGYGTFDKFTYQVGETGSIGKLGIAVLHTDRQGNSPLTFNDYLDASGLAYAHDGESSNRGDFLKLRYSLTESTTLNFTALQNNQNSSSLCTQYVTLVPCGIGPGNYNAGKFQFVYGSVQTLIGETALSVTGYINDNVSNLNDINRLIDGAPSPFSSQNTTLARGLAFSSTLTRNKHTFTLTGSTYASQTSFTPLINTGTSQAFVIPATTGVASQQYAFADSYKYNDKLTLGGNLSLASTNGAGTSFVGGLSASWAPTVVDQFSGSVSVGSAQAAAGLLRTFSDPNSARVNCAAGTAQVSGPGDQPSRQSSVSYDAGWQHQFKHGSLQADIYRQVQGGQLVNALLNGTSANLPPLYTSLIDQYYVQPTVCGSGTPAVYINELIGNTTRVYQGYDIAARIGFGPNIVVIPSYATNSAVITAADARLAAANSTTIVGAQIVGRPLHRANVTIDANEPHSGFEFLANANYTGDNNNQHIEPYTLVNAGLSHQFGIGRLTFFASNLFNVESGVFSTLQYAQPIPLSGGGSLLTAANPNTPRQYTLTFSFNTGGLRGAGNARGVAGNRSAGAGSGAGRVAAAPGAGGAGPGGAGRLGGRFTFVPPPTGADPLAIPAGRTTCPADAAVKAQPVLDQFKAAIAAYKAGTKLPDITGFTITGTGDPKSDHWSMAFRPSFGRGPGAGAVANRPGAIANQGSAGGPPGEGGGPPPGPPRVTSQSDTPRPRASLPPEVQARLDAFRAFVGCAYITALKSDDAKAKNILEKGPTFGYAPEVGLFFVQPPDLGTGGGSVKQ